MSKKPTGKIGPDSVKVSSVGMERDFTPVIFPGTKEQIEEMITSLFVQETKKQGFNFLSVTQNVENHFDYTLDLPGGKVYLDLAEVIYRDSAGSPYAAPNKKIHTADYAEQIRELVLKKSDHYGRKSSVPIHLLLYLTHWRFAPSENVIRLAQHYLKQRVHIIENVFLLVPVTSDEAVVRVLFPSKNPLKGAHPISLANDWYSLGDLDTAEFDPETGTVKLVLPT